jgi:ribosome-associated translation inhibitor RaiA
MVTNSINYIFNYLGESKNVYSEKDLRENLETSIATKLIPLEEQTKIAINSIVFTFKAHAQGVDKYSVEAQIESSDLDYTKTEHSDNPSVAVHKICDDLIQIVRKAKEKKI